MEYLVTPSVDVNWKKQKEKTAEKEYMESIHSFVYARNSRLKGTQRSERERASNACIQTRI